MPLKKIIIVSVIGLSLISPFVAAAPAYAQTVGNFQTFGSEPAANETSKGKNLLGCLSGFRQFISATIGYEGFADYWRDLYIGIRWPMYFSDIANVEQQLNKARYEVMAAFMNCDVNRLKTVTEAYYRLEAELYFVRHFIDIGAGTIRARIDSGEGISFAKEMVDYFVLRKTSDDPTQDMALFNGYFDLFSAKYSDRAATYKSYSEDPIFGSIIDKFDELVDAFKSAGSLGEEMGGLGKDTWDAGKKGALAVGGAASATYNNPIGSLGNVVKSVSNAFQICPDATNPTWGCMSFADAIARGAAKTWSATKEVGSAIAGGASNAWYAVAGVTVTGTSSTGATTTTRVGGVLNDLKDIKDTIVESITSSGEKKTYADIETAIKETKVMAAENAQKADMLTRYEVLYGQVSGEGVRDLTAKIDKLYETIEKGSLPALNTFGQCVAKVQGNECANVSILHSARTLLR
jgi:hypothetical protein